MASSTLLHEDTEPPKLPKGHDTASLGPSDSSDSGSDTAGGGPDLGDSNLDSDSDRNGTGERGAAGRDTPGPTDTILHRNDEKSGERR